MLVAILWTFISVFGVLFGIYYLFGNRELYNKTKHINGPRVFPLIGNAYHFIGDSTHLLKQLMTITKNYTSPMRGALGSRVFILSTDPEQIKIILQSPQTAEKYYPYCFAKDWMGVGLITARNKTWRIHRKMIQPAFNQKILNSFVSIFNKNSLLLIQKLEEKIGGPEFDISPCATSISIYNVCESVMGVPTETHRKDVEEFYVMNHTILTILFKRLIQIWLHPNIFFRLSQLSKDYFRCIKYINTFIDKVIRKRRTILEETALSNEGNGKIILDSLLEISDDGNKFNDKELRDHVITLATAASDTASRTLEFVLLMLAQYPNVQDKVYEEIHNFYGSEDPKNNPVKYEDLNKLVCLERVIKETMRLFPIAPVISREVVEDLLLGGCLVPKGCTVLIPIFLIHRNEKIWLDPLKFDPDRFLPENSIDRHPCAFIPFSYGARDCIGRTFTMMMMKVVVATIVRKYVLKKVGFTEPGDIKLKADTLLFPAEPITLQLERREN